MIVLFQHNGAHTTSSTIEKLKEEIELLMGWPPNFQTYPPLKCFGQLLKDVSHTVKDLFRQVLTNYKIAYKKYGIILK